MTRYGRWCAVGVLALLCAAVPATAVEHARGFVFEDTNENGERDPGEPGIAGVAVSNGLEVVQTTQDGSYRLPIEDNSILFITKPAGYDVPVDQNNLPHFYYRHYPGGTPADLELYFPGVERTGPLPESVDFPLLRSEPLDNFEVIFFADPQPKTAAEVDYIRDDIVAELVGTDAAFGMTLGDIMYDVLSMYPRYNEIVGKIGIPWYNVPGNHDVNSRSPDDERSLETFKSLFGPGYYSFDYGQAHFVALDTVNYLGNKQNRKKPHRGDRDVEYEGWVVEKQLAWLKNDMALVPADKLIVLTMHIPLAAHGDRRSVRGFVNNTDELLRIIGERGHVMAFSGHLHSTEHHYLENGLHMHSITTASGSWWGGPKDERGIPVAYQECGTPNGYHVMRVEGNRATMRYKAAGEPMDYQMRLFLDGSTLTVNLFDGGPRSKVEYRIDGRAPVSMERRYRNDPFVDDLFLRYRRTYKSFVEIDPSSHLWVAGLPEDLGSGVHTIVVEAVDEYGRTHTGALVFE
jgi:hypothetical protein